MLAPPNHGSRVAAIAAKGFHYLCPALSDISTEPGSLVHQLPEPAAWEVGVIAAQSDWLVSVESTHLSNQRDHIGIDCGHNMILFRAESMRETVYFLRHGQFSSAASRIPQKESLV